MKKLLLTALSAVVPLMIHATEVSVTSLSAEQMENPLGLNTAAPRLGWLIVSDGRNVMQTAYRILVASSPDLLDRGEGDLWDSGVVYSDSSQWVPYGGKGLRSNDRAYWKVKSYTTAGESEWSETAVWSVGLLKEVHWRGQWIGMERLAPWDSDDYHSRLSARYLRKDFEILKPVRRATLHIAGLGMYELFINGRRIGDQQLAPAPTDYRKTVIYNTFDVTDQLAAQNAIGVTLGNGRYYAVRQNSLLYGSECVTFAYPKLRLNLILEFTDGSRTVISTDQSWKLNPDGPIRSNNDYDGEEYDARKELGDWTLFGYDDSSWRPAEKVPAPTGTLRGKLSPNMKVLHRIGPVSVTKHGDKYILDMGQNFAGWLRIKVRGAEGDTIRLRFAELLQENGELYTANLRTARQTDLYVCSGREPEGTEWSPRFVYHGFRYVEVSGYPDAVPEDFTGEVVSDEMEVTGSFECSDEVLNRVYRNAFWGILSNYKGFPVDCPQRDERQPWLGDRGMGLWGESYIFGIEPLYMKWVRDICEAQREDGCIPNLAPAFGKNYDDNVTWPFALPSACDMLYTNYANPEAIAMAYPHLKTWVRHLCDEYMTPEGVIIKDCYADWCVPPESLELIHSNDPARKTSGRLIGTAYIVKVAQLMQRFASLLGLEEDAREYGEFAKAETEAFNKAFLTFEGGGPRYGNNTVTANILPLAFGMVPAEYESAVEGNVVNAVRESGHVSCGVIGMQWLLRELSRRGHGDLAWMLATNSTYPSWGYMAEQGATTIWELWNGNTADPAMNSANHVMLLGDLIRWCYENVGGIRSSSEFGLTGFKHIVLAPDFGIKDARHADVTLRSIYGPIVSRWEKDGDRLRWEIEVPANTTAEVHFPDGAVEHIGSGHYSYER